MNETDEVGVEATPIGVTPFQQIAKAVEELESASAEVAELQYRNSKYKLALSLLIKGMEMNSVGEVVVKLSRAESVIVSDVVRLM